MMLALTLSLALSQTDYYSPVEARALFDEANEAFNKQDYAGAQTRYLKLLERGAGGPDVLYNLGTAYLAEGRLGPAVLHLERAARLERRDDIDGQLQIARARQLDQVVGATAELPFLSRIVHALPERGFSWGLVALMWLSAIAWALFRLRPAGKRAGLAVLGTLTTFGALAVGSVVAVHAYVATELHEAIVVSDVVQVHDLPSDTSKVSFEIHAGLKVRVVEDSGKFARVRLPNGLEGWTQSEGVTRL